MQGHIDWRGNKMIERITRFLREYVFTLSIITLIIGLIILFMGVIWYWFKDLELGFYTDIINQLGDWNAYLIIVGFIIIIFAIYYLYSFLKNKKFVLKELKTNKRSEFIKRHSEVKTAVKHLPSKYQKMFQEKERELKIR